MAKLKKKTKKAAPKARKVAPKAVKRKNVKAAKRPDINSFWAVSCFPMRWDRPARRREPTWA